MILSEKIITLRKRNGWSQEELAEKLDVSRQAVSKWESAASLPDLDKILRLSQVFEVSTDYLLKDDREDPSQRPAEYVETYQGTPLRKVSLEEANSYMETVRANALRISLGVMLCILSPAPLLLLEGFGLTGRGLYDAFGTALLLLMIAAAVPLFIISSLKGSPYEHLSTEDFSLEYGVSGIVEKKKAGFEKTYTAAIAAGVALCIAGISPLLVAGTLDVGEDSDPVICVTLVLLLGCVAAATLLFIRSGMIQSSYRRLLQIGEYQQKEKHFRRKAFPVRALYWTLCTALCLGLYFYTLRWEIWLIYPCAAVLFGGVKALSRYLYFKHNP